MGIIAILKVIETDHFFSLKVLLPQSSWLHFILCRSTTTKKPVGDRDVNGFSCMVKFQKEEENEENSIYLNLGFTPLKVEKRTCYSRGSLYLIDYTDCAIL